MYGFAAKENAAQFAAQPDAFIKSAMEVTTKTLNPKP